MVLDNWFSLIDKGDKDEIENQPESPNGVRNMREMPIGRPMKQYPTKTTPTPRC